MEINFTVSDTFIGGSVAGLPGVLLKNEELVQGSPLVGASARVVGNSFLFALSASPEDARPTTTLITARKWMDLAIIYATGKRAIITLEKDAAAETMFNEVFAAWGAHGLSYLRACRPRCGSACAASAATSSAWWLTRAACPACASRSASGRASGSRLRVASSSAENGSSSSRIGRLRSSVRASATRCFWPPDSVDARWLPMSGKPDFGERGGDRLAGIVPRRARRQAERDIAVRRSGARTASRTGRGSRPGALRAAAAGGRVPSKRQRARGRLQEAGDEVEQGRLARAAGAARSAVISPGIAAQREARRADGSGARRRAASSCEHGLSLSKRRGRATKATMVRTSMSAAMAAASLVR